MGADPSAVVGAVRPALERSDVPGAVVVVVRDGRIVASIAHGIDPATGEPIRVDELFQVGSISKAVSAMAVASLVDQGVIDWDDDVRDHLTSYDLLDPYDEPVTFARLLSHTAGATVEGFPGYPPGSAVPSAIDVLAGRGNSPEVVIAGEPGSRYAYSGGGYTVVQQALVDLTGREFAALVHELVLEPTGAVSATFAQPLPVARLGEATAGSIGGDAVDPFVYPEQAAAGLWASGLDLAAVVIGFQHALAGEASWLGADNAAYLVESDAADFTGFVGHGLFVERERDPAWFWHRGRNTGYSAEMIGSVDGRHGLVVVTNALDAQVMIRAVVAAVADVEAWDGYPI
ncbi:MAG: serine hydrolase domain-containing protein [Acidimicrobiales bacterium]